MFDHCFTFYFHSILNRCLAQCINSLSKTTCMVVLLLLFIFTFDAFIIYIVHTIFYSNLLLLRGRTRTRTRTKGLHLTSMLVSPILNLIWNMLLNNMWLYSNDVHITVAYVEGRDEAERGASNQPLTQVSILVRSFRKMICFQI